MPALPVERCRGCGGSFQPIAGEPTRVCPLCIQDRILPMNSTCIHWVSLSRGCASCQRMFGSNQLRSFRAKTSPRRSRANDE